MNPCAPTLRITALNRVLPAAHPPVPPVLVACRTPPPHDAQLPHWSRARRCGAARALQGPCLTSLHAPHAATTPTSEQGGGADSGGREGGIRGPASWPAANVQAADCGGRRARLPGIARVQARRIEERARWMGEANCGPGRGESGRGGGHFLRDPGPVMFGNAPGANTTRRMPNTDTQRISRKGPWVYPDLFAKPVPAQVQRPQSADKELMKTQKTPHLPKLLPPPLHPALPSAVVSPAIRNICQYAVLTVLA
ncbi:hypothetical protein B0H14DRAFT_2606998 [Mycena olivaceomarginata]|nr:hypothetical protein B0H14DRAFT_2606998 [Mycena olivaceomarginata]